MLKRRAENTQLQGIPTFQPIQAGLERVEEKLKGLANHRFPFLTQMLSYALDQSGKRVRPTLTLLASSFHAHDSRNTVTMAAAVEMLHIASLLHDDTVDNSEVKHGIATMNSLLGRDKAVLVGDYIFAASANLVCDAGDMTVLRRFSETVMDLSTGELWEITQAYNWRQTRALYIERIYYKTASLFTMAGEAGAMLSGGPEDAVKALRDYSRNLGMAFQIVDDILDFQGTEEELGKTVANDLSHGIMTLPAIIAMERNPLDNPISALFQHPHDSTHMKSAMEMIKQSSIIDETYAVAARFCDKALGNLKVLPQTSSRDCLEELASYVLNRRR